MKNSAHAILLTVSLLASAAWSEETTPAAAEAAGSTPAAEAPAKIMTNGAAPGQWTMDLDAAKTVAAEQKLPILLDFSGSDWCGWCKLMEQNVFTRPEWQAYAAQNLMMVLIDFPQDKSLVPEKYAERNQSLNDAYNIEGFPTFIVLDDDGQTELGRLGAGRDKTPESFIAELKSLFFSRAAEVEKFTGSLAPEKKIAFQELNAKLEKTKALLDTQSKLLDTQNKLMEETEKKIAELEQSVADAEKEIKMFRMEQQLGAEEFKAYKELQDKFDAAVTKLENWIATGPDHTDENTRLYEAMMEEIQTLQAQLSKY
jgi:thioredoxin-related protein